jgi:hypothetical protein
LAEGELVRLKFAQDHSTGGTELAYSAGVILCDVPPQAVRAAFGGHPADVDDIFYPEGYAVEGAAELPLGSLAVGQAGRCAGPSLVHECPRVGVAFSVLDPVQDGVEKFYR